MSFALPWVEDDPDEVGRFREAGGPGSSPLPGGPQHESGRSAGTIGDIVEATAAGVSAGIAARRVIRDTSSKRGSLL